MKRILLLLFALTLPIATFADFYKSIRESNGEIVLTLQVPSSSLKLDRTHQNFTQVKLTDTKAIGAAGEPALPIISRLLAVSPSDYTASIEVSNPVVFKGVNVYPIQPDHKENLPSKPFAYKQSAYAKDQKPSVNLGERSSIGNTTVLPVRVNPFARHGDQLTLFQTITIHLKPAGNAKLIRQDKKAAATSLFNHHQQKFLITQDGLKDTFTSPKEVSTVMVLTSKALLADAEAYSALHPEHTMEVKTIKEGASFSDVKKIISDRYTQGHLDTVVLYGDERHIPEAIWDAVHSDSFYQYLDATKPNYTSIAIGRIPVQNHADAKFYNSKLAAYLKNQKTDSSKNVMLVAHSEEYPYKYTANQEVIRKADNPMGFVYHTEYGGLDATNASVLLEAPKHYPLINYRGHGDDQSWWNWDNNGQGFNKDSISLLKNTDENVSVFFNIACDTATFESPTRNMAENLIFLENQGSSYRGAIAVLGATEPSWTVVNDSFDIHLFEFMQNEKHLPLGHLVALANDKLTLESEEIPENVKMYVVLGDPLISIWH